MSDDEDYDAISNENDGDNVTEAVSSRNAAKPSKSSKKASASAGSVGGKRKKPDVIEDESDAAADDDLVDDADAPVGGAGAAAPAKPKVVSESSISSSRAAAGKPNPYAGAAQAAMAANKKITTEREAEAVLIDYLNSTNRPYSALNVFDNLHGIIGKTVVPTLLDKLVDKGAISAKTYGKFKLYWADQGQYSDTTSADVASLQATVESQRELLAAAKSKRRELEATASSLSSALTAEQLAEQLSALRASTAAAREKLARLTGAGTKLVTPAERSAAVATLDRYRKAWAERKRIVCDVVDSMSEGLGRKPKVLMADIGIETDEDAKVNIKDFASK